MATTRRDIELLISAKETTGRSFKQVTDNIDALNKKIGEQVAAAERGEISLQDLRKTQEQLAQAGRDLSAIQSQIDAYNRLVASQDKVAASATKAQADLAKQRAEMAAAEKVTTSQENKLQRLENAVVRTSAALEKNTQDIAQQAAVLERAGVETKNLDTAQAGIVNTARQIGAGLVQVNAAIDTHAISVQRAKDIEQSWAAQAGFDRKIAEAARLGDASRFVQLFGDAINTVRVADNQLSALTGFRAVGAMAAEAANDMSRFVQTGQTMSAVSSQVAAGLRNIIDPGGAAIQTLSGVEAAIAAADEKAGEGVKNVAQLNDAYNDLAAAGAALLRQGGLVDSFQQQAAATAAARQQFEAAQAEVIQLGKAMQAADAPTEQLANALSKAEANLEKTGRALTQEETKLGQLSKELKAAGINTADLAGEQARLEAAAEGVAGATQRINQSLGRGGQRTNGLFGLRPHELANLNFQIQDIIVSLQAGQAPLTVLFQQGSQLSQIFPGLISSVAKLVLRFLPLIAVVTVVASVFGSLIDQTNRLKQAQEDLARIPGGDGLNPQRYADAQKALEGMGASAEEARTAMRSLAEEGFDDAALEKYSKTAAQLAQELGVDLAEATQMLIDIQRGGIDAVYELAEKTNGLTEADLDHAEALYEAGKAGEARQFILDRMAERNQQIADATQSQWTPAVNNLKSAWSSFTGFLEKIFGPILDQINRQINNTILGFTYLTALLAGKGFGGALKEAEGVFNMQRGRGPQAPAAGASDQNIRDRRFAQELDDEIDSTRELTRQERLRKVEVEARRRAQDAGVSKSLEDRAVQQAIAAEQRKINQENERERKKGASAANKAARAAAAEQRKREQAQRQLDRQMRQLRREASRGGAATLDDRLAAIDEKYESIAESIAKVRALGLGSDSNGTPLSVIEKQVAATKQRLKDEETIKYFQEQTSLLIDQREAELNRINDLRKREALTTQEAMDKTAEVVGRISPQIVAAAQNALAMARAIAGANPSPEMVSWIAALERIIEGERTDRSVADMGLAGLSEQEARLNTLLQERDTLVSAYEELAALGVKTPEEVRAATAAAFAAQSEAIQPVLDKLRATLEALRGQVDPLTGLPILTETAYNAWIAKIDAVNAGLQQQTTYLSALEQETFANVTQAGLNTFDALSEGIAGLITGTKSFGAAFAAVGKSILQGLADILASIARVIMQFLILRALESAAGLPPGTLGGGGGGRPRLFGLFHDGGVVGSRRTQVQRRTGMSDSWFGAPKFHGGGGAGLRPDEYKAVLKRGEEVLTEDDPRHIRNVGDGEGGGGPAMGIKQVLVLDPAAVPQAMRSRSGVQSILTVIRTNKETIKEALR